MADTFGEYCSALIGQYNGNIKKLVEESTEMIFNLILKNQNLQVRRTKKGEIIKGKFYVIQYNYNGNKIWCPVFVIDDRYNTELQKRIIYAINLDYLPYRYKIAYFDKMFKLSKYIIDKNKIINDQDGNVNDEKPLDVNFEIIYKSLKNNGEFSYSITAYDYTKIVGIEKGDPRIYGISTTILSRFIFIDSKIINKNIMMQHLRETDILEEKLKLEELLKLLDKITFDYDNDVKEYYQRLKLIENNYKLYKNI